MFDSGWVQLIAPEIVECRTDCLVLAHTPKPAHFNHNGDVAAGVIFSLAEMAGVGALVVALGDAVTDANVVVKHCDLAFHAPARGPIRAVGRPDAATISSLPGNLQESGRIEEVVPVLVFDHDEQLVAEANVTGLIRRERAAFETS